VLEERDEPTENDTHSAEEEQGRPNALGVWPAHPEPSERERSQAETPEANRSPAMWIAHASPAE